MVTELTPLTFTSPLVGRSSRKISLRIVLLPAPLGPGEEDELSLAHVERHVVQREAGARGTPLWDVREADHPIYFSACSMSAMMSSASSIPTLMRRKPSGMPMRARSSLDIAACDV